MKIINIWIPLLFLILTYPVLCKKKKFKIHMSPYCARLNTKSEFHVKQTKK